MKKRQNNSTGASALQIAFPIALLFASAILFAAASGQSVRAAVPESSAVSKRAEARKSAPVGFSISREHVGGREIAGFSALQAPMVQEQNLTAPAGLKPVEQEAWLAMARRQGVSGGHELASFCPKPYGEPFVVEGEGVRGSWVTTGSLATARASHTATLLPNGMVLVAGGDVIGGALSSAELYDSATGSWSSTGSLAARHSHTATLLSSGKVLVAGGYGNGVFLSSAELYDPAAGSWSSTGSLATARFQHTATLLPSGQVLVAGGYNGSFLSSAELYDPGTGSWSSTGSLGTARFQHTATLLPSGQVLVAGGYNGSSLSSAELYDPGTGSWSSTGSLATARRAHTATLLPSGQVLVAGGAAAGTSDSLRSAELYDPGTGSWSSTGSLGAARSDYAATLLPSGEMLVAAGYDSGTLRSAELYDPGTGSWSSTGSLATARTGHTATLLPNGKVLVAGGGNDAGMPLRSAELYDPAAVTVSQITPVETTCSQFSSDTAETLGSVQYSRRHGLIGRFLPRSFLYWVPVTAPAGDNVFRITQTITSGNFDTFFAVKGDGSNVFDSDCVSLQRSIRQSGDTTTIRFNAPAADTYFIAINFDTRSLIGEPVPHPTTVHYVFTTTGLPHSTSGLDLIND